jgi:hypothetical protein
MMFTWGVRVRTGLRRLHASGRLFVWKADILHVSGERD